MISSFTFLVVQIFCQVGLGDFRESIDGSVAE